MMIRRVPAYTMFPKCLSVLIVLLSLQQHSTFADENQADSQFPKFDIGKRPTQEELNRHVKNLIQHYKQDDPRGLPSGFNEHIPDPMPVPNLNQEFSGTKMYFEDLKVYGLSRFRLEHVRSDLKALKVSVGVSIDELQILGKYTMSSWWNSAKGNFSVRVFNVSTEAEGKFDVSPEGFLMVQHIEMDLKFEDIKMNFENLGWFGKIFQGMVNSVGAFLFDSIKPMILQEVERDARSTLNKEARNVPQQFPNSINPLDMAIASARNVLKQRNLDPLSLPDHILPFWSFTFESTDCKLEGLATLHRTGDIIIGFENNIVFVTLNLGAENLNGKCNWSWGFFKGLMKKRGVMQFNLEYLTVAVKVQQPANLDLPPSVDDLDLDIGNISVRSDGAGTLDYFVEATFNVLPNIFRKQIIDAIEKPIRQAVEEEMRKVKIEALIEEHF